MLSGEGEDRWPRALPSTNDDLADFAEGSGGLVSVEDADAASRAVAHVREFEHVMNSSDSSSKHSVSVLRVDQVYSFDGWRNLLRLRDRRFLPK